MASQQQFPLDLNTPLAQLWARNGGRQRQKDQLLSVQSATMQNEQLRSDAHMEARSWAVMGRKKRAALLGTKWKEAKDCIETRNPILETAEADGHSFNK